MSDNWTEDQLKPLNMFELASKWTDGLKVLGSANGAALIAAGAALHAFSARPEAIFWVKFAGIIFFVGVFAFAIAFACIHRSVFYFDEMLHATRDKDAVKINSFSEASTRDMMAANWLAIVATLAFFVGCLFGLIALIKV